MTDVKTILVVDDSRVSRLMARQYIHSKYPTWLVEEAGSGEEALEKVKTITPVLILIDVNMPGMGGLAAAELLRDACPAAQLSLVTANVQNATRNRASELGIGFMEKPITEQKVHDLIAKLEG
jgi:two-component system chemotaxis response regulator CheY